MFTFGLLTAFMVAPDVPKCPARGQMPGFDPDKPVMMVDDRVIQPDSIGLEAEEIGWIAIMCWDPETNAFARDGIPIVRITTSAVVDAVQLPLLQLIQAQEKFHSRHDRWAPDLESLEPFGLTATAGLKYEASGAHWTASTPAEGVAMKCFVNEKLAVMIGKDGKPELDCSLVDDVALRALRERYDQGMARAALTGGVMP